MNGRLLRGVAGLVGIFAVWEIANQVGLVDTSLLPAPTGVVARVFTLFGDSDFRVALVASLLTWALSLLITIAIALPVGIVLGSLPAVRTATSAVVEFIRPIPAVSLIPVCMVLIGGGTVTNITLAVFAGFWPMLFTIVAGIRETDPMLMETARVFGLRRFAVAARVRLPSVARAAVVGVRVAVGIELIVIVSTGLISGIDGGIGLYLWNAGDAVGDEITVLAGTVIIGVLGYAVNQGLLGLQQVRWLHPSASSAPETESSRPTHWAARFVQRWGVLVVLVLLWQLVTMRLGNLYAPTPARIATEAWQNASTLATSLPISLGKLGFGWAIAVVGGVGFGLVLGMLPRAADVIEPVGAFIRAIPPVLLLPILVIWTHFGTSFEVTTIALGCAWPLLVTTIEGVRSIEPVLIDTSHTYRTGRLRHMFTVVLPAAAPKVVTGLRISLSLALILMVITELLGGNEGLGFQLNFAEQEFEYPLMWACIVLLGLLGYVLNQLLLTADRRLVSWRHQTAETQ